MRRTFLILGILAAATALSLAALPWWLGRALTLAEGRTGLSFAEYQTLGYARFVLIGARFERGPVTVTADRLEATTPIAWLLGDRQPVRIDRWALEAASAAPGPTGGREASSAPVVRTTPHGMVPVLAETRRWLDQLAPWLPPVELGPGELRLGALRLTLEQARYTGDTVHVTSLRWRRWSAHGAVTWAGVEDWRVTAQDPGGQWQADASSAGPRWQGRLAFLEQVATAEAVFGETGWWPRTAHMRAEDWRLPAAALGWGDAYEDLAGRAEIDWQDRRVRFAVQAEAEPAAGRASAAPPLQIDLRGGGAWNDFAIEAADVRLPGVRAALSAPVRVRPTQLDDVGTSTFEVEIDLGAWPTLLTQGRLAGQAMVTTRLNATPAVDLVLKAQGLTHRDAPAVDGTVSGQVVWPWLRRVDARLQSASGSSVEAGGDWQWTERRLEAGRVRAVLASADVAKYLPAGMSLESVELAGTAAGVWPDWQHEGTAAWTGLVLPAFHANRGQARWSGDGTRVSPLALEVASGDAQVDLTGNGDAASGQGELTALRWHADGHPSLVLAKPVQVSWRDGWRSSTFSLAGGDTLLEAEGELGPSGRGRLAVRGFSSDRLAPWLSLAGPAWRIDALAWSGDWTAGPLRHEGTATFDVTLGAQREATVELAFAGQAGALRIGRLAVSEESSPVLEASGELPLGLWPFQAEPLRLDPSGVLNVTAHSQPNAAFWARLADVTGVRLQAPRLAAQLSGTWARPQGGLELAADQIALEGPRWPAWLPPLAGLRLRASGDGERLALDELTVAAAGQTVRASGSLPVEADTWERLRQAPWDHLRREASGRIEIPDAEMAGLSRLMPAYLAPSGRIDAQVSLARGGAWTGHVRLRGAASRPLGPLGVLQDITADLSLEGRTLRLREVSARMGGQPVVITGEATLPTDAPVRLDLRLQGNNLPLVRQTGLLVRADLDVRAEPGAPGETRLAGQVRLRDGLFLADLLSLLPGGGSVAAPDRRPPYFAVNVAPLDAWILDVEVSGDRFLRLRTPVFVGEASARFRLGGTLGAPRAVGQATIDTGDILLPFATFRVNQGSVRLTEADPFVPVLAVTGTGRRFGYDLHLELSGPATTPQLRFSSSPPLSSEDVLLMVMAGEPPGDEVTYTGRQRVVRLGTYLGQSVLRGLGGDPAAAERFSLTTGERVSRQGRETYGFSYELDSRWSLVGEYDEFDDYNVGVKWRLLGGTKEESHAP